MNTFVRPVAPASRGLPCRRGAKAVLVIFAAGAIEWSVTM